MELEVHNEEGNVTGTITLDEKTVLGEKVRRRLLHQALVMYQANQRHGTHKTKTRAERRGGGAKPWRQKGTGRARAGSRRSPIWRKGGVIHGPQPRSHRREMPKSARRAALRSALLAKLLDGEIKVIDSLSFDEPKTRRMAGILQKLGLADGSCLITPMQTAESVLLSARNLPRVNVLEARNLNAYEVLRPKRLLVTRDVIENLQELVR